MTGTLVQRSENARSIIPAAVLCTLAALLLAFFLAMNPRMVEAHAKVEAQLAEEIARENRAFCERLGFPTDAREHGACTQDLNEIRAKHGKRIYESVSGML